MIDNDTDPYAKFAPGTTGITPAPAKVDPYADYAPGKPAKKPAVPQTEESIRAAVKKDQPGFTLGGLRELALGTATGGDGIKRAMAAEKAGVDKIDLMIRRKE